MSTRVNDRMFEQSLEDVFLVLDDGSEFRRSRSQRSFSSSLDDLLDGSSFLHQEKSMFSSDILNFEDDDSDHESLFPTFAKSTNDSPSTQSDHIQKHEDSIDILEALIQNLEELCQEPEAEEKISRAPLPRVASQKRIDKVSQLSHVLNVRVERRLAKKTRSVNGSLMSISSCEASVLPEHSTSIDHDKRRQRRRRPDALLLRRSKRTSDTSVVGVRWCLQTMKARRETFDHSDMGQGSQEHFESNNLIELERRALQQQSTEHIETLCHRWYSLSPCSNDHERAIEPPERTSLVNRMMEETIEKKAEKFPPAIDKPVSNRGVVKDEVRTVFDVLKLKTSQETSALPLSIPSTRSLANLGNNILGVSLRDISINTDFSAETSVDNY